MGNVLSTFSKHNEAERCAKDIINLLLKRKLWNDVIVYANGKCWSNQDADGHYHYDGRTFRDNVFMTHDEPSRCFESYGDFLSMSFEGSFYYIMNCYDYKNGSSIRKQFNDILTKYNKCYVLGDAWNLSLYDLRG